MRKLLFILLALAGCLLCSERDGGMRGPQHVQTAVFAVGDSLSDQWQCERVCNSDLNRPRVLREAEACPTAPVFRYGGQSASVRAAVRCAAACGRGTGVAQLTSTFQSSDLPAGRHAVDYYVYRLRRLII